MRRTAWTVRRPTCWGRAGRHGKGAAGRSTSGCRPYPRRLLALLLRARLSRDLLKLGAERRLLRLCCGRASHETVETGFGAPAARALLHTCLKPAPGIFTVASPTHEHWDIPLMGAGVSPLVIAPAAHPPALVHKTSAVGPKRGPKVACVSHGRSCMKPDPSFNRAALLRAPPRCVHGPAGCGYSSAHSSEVGCEPHCSALPGRRDAHGRVRRSSGAHGASNAPLDVGDRSRRQGCVEHLPHLQQSAEPRQRAARAGSRSSRAAEEGRRVQPPHRRRLQLAPRNSEQAAAVRRDCRSAYRLSVALQGRLVVWSGTPDQGTYNRDLKDKLIQSLAVWARGADSAVAAGLIVLDDHSEVASQRYAWLKGFAGLAVSPDTAAQVYDSVEALTATGTAILDNGGTQLAYPAMASFGVQPPAAASGAAVDARGGSAEGQVVLVTSPRRLASVKTDKPDYSPGETVTFTGSGWEPGEVVTLLLHEDTTLHDDRTLTATADPLGNISNNEFKPEPHDVGVTFYVTASGQASGLAAQTRFTDGTVKVMSAPAGVTFTLTWTRFSTTVCTGTVVDGGTATVGSSGGAVFSKNVGNTESIKLEASATSNQGGAFVSWTGPAGTFTTDPLNPRIICVSGKIGRASCRERV